MEILSTNYNYRNPFVAGFLPDVAGILNVHDQVDSHDNQLQNKKINLNKKNRPHQSMKSFHVMLTTSLIQSNANHNECSVSLKTTSLNQNNEITSSCQINVSKLDSSPKSIKSEIAAASTPKQLQISKPMGKNKKSLKNKRQKQARSARRILKKQRHVHFAPDDCVQVIYIIEDEFDAECRMKYWETFAIDRFRFKDRLMKIQKCLNSVLSPSHRERIYKERFECSEDSGIENSTTTDSDRDEHDSDNEISLSIKFTTTLHFFNPTSDCV